MYSNRLNLQTLGSQLVMPKNLPDHCTTLEGPMEYVIQLNFIKSFLPLTNESSCSSCWHRRATSHTRLRARDHYTSSTLIGGKGRASPSLLQTWHIWGTIIVYECTMDVKSTWIPTRASNGSCFMVTWTIFQNHLLKVGLIQNWEIMALWNLTTAGLLYFITCEDPHE